MYAHVTLLLWLFRKINQLNHIVILILFIIFKTEIIIDSLKFTTLLL